MTTDVEAWLEHIGLDKYGKVFADNDVGIDTLALLTDEDLRELGLPLGPRKKLQQALIARAPSPRTLNEETQSSALTLADSSMVERRQLTIMFCDLVDSTALSERFDPEDLSNILRSYQDICTGIVNRFDGYVARYVGDGILVYFGYPLAHENDAERSLLAGLAIIEAVRTSQSNAAIVPQVRIGAATGLTMVGETIGSGTSQQQVAVGTTPNIAARLQGIAAPNSMVIDGNTQRLAGGGFEYSDLGQHDLKGLSKPLGAWLVTGERPIRSRFDAMRERARTMFIGRDEELARLESAVDSLHEGNGSIISISGEAGTGKSRLIEELQLRVPDRCDTWLTSNTHEHSQVIPYYPMIDLLNQALGIEEDDLPERVQKKVTSGLRNLLKEPDAAIPYVGSLYALEHPALTGVSPEYWEQQLYKALLAIFQALATRSPVIFFFEDLHWADPPTLRLLRYILVHFREPAIILCTYRPPFQLFDQEHIQEVPSYQELTLEALSEAQTSALVHALLQTGAAPPELIDFAQVEAGGNPFYVEELIVSLVESESLVQDQVDWRLAGPLHDFQVPSTVQGVIAARLDRLERDSRRLLQEASVIGRTFYHRVLGQITELAGNLDGRLDTLERSELIHTLILDPELEYMFKHALTREVAYNSLLKSERSAIHERVAISTEELLADRLPEFYETLAFHFHQGRSVDKAVDYLIKSGEKSANRFALDEANEYYAQAYALLTKNLDRTIDRVDILLALLEKWAIVFYYFGTFGDLLELLRKNESLAETAQDKARQGMFAAWMGWALFFRQRRHDAHRYLLRALSLGESADDPRVIAYACTWLAGSCAALSQYDNGIAYGERAQELALTMPEEHFLYFKSVAMTGFNYSLMGDVVNTRDLGERLVKYAKRSGNPRSFMFGYWLISDGFANSGDFDAAMRTSEKAVYDLKDPFYLLHARAIHGVKCVLNGNLNPMLEEAIDVSRIQGNEFLVNWWGGFLGLGRVIQGRMSEGMKMIEKCSQRSLENEDINVQRLGEVIKGKIYLKMAIGPPPPIAVMLKNLVFLLTHLPFAPRRAEVLLENAARFYGETGAYGFRAQILLDLGLLHRAKKRKQKAIACLTEAESLFDQAGAEVFLSQTRLLLGELQP